MALVVAVTFILGGVAKLASPDQAADFLRVAAPRAFGGSAGLLITAVSMAEVVLGVCLLTGARRSFFLLAAGCFFAVATLALFAAKRGGFEGSCGCFGSFIRSGLDAAVVRNALFLFMVGLVLVGSAQLHRNGERTCDLEPG